MIGVARPRAERAGGCAVGSIGPSDYNREAPRERQIGLLHDKEPGSEVHWVSTSVPSGRGATQEIEDGSHLLEQHGHPPRATTKAWLAIRLAGSWIEVRDDLAPIG